MPESKTFAKPFDPVRLRALAFDITCLAVVLSHAVLIWYDCAAQWGTPGLFAGAIAFLTVIAALLVATDPTRVRTSESALYVVLLIDVAAWWVHYPTFMRDSHIGATQTGVISALICCFSFAALYLYRDSKLD